MQEYKLKYGCNPDQSTARIFMRNDKELPIEILNGRPGYINFLDALNSWQLVRELRKNLNLPSAASFKHVSPAGAALGLPLNDVEKRIFFVDEKALFFLVFVRIRTARAEKAHRQKAYRRHN